MKMKKDGHSQNRESLGQRLGEIDVLKTVAIVLMVLYHFVYDLTEYTEFNIDYRDSFWFIVGKISALFFIFISGLANGFSRSPVRRGGRVLFYGIIITVATYLVLNEEYVRFGILHFLGVTMILSPVLFRLSSRTLWGLAVSSALVGFWFKNQVLKTSLFLPFGLRYDGFSSIDYYPLFPYLAVSILGILAYQRFYVHRTIPRFSFRQNSKLVRWTSQNSLGIYLLHQPIILLIFFIIKGFQL